MDLPQAIWLADLMLAHVDLLAAELTTAARGKMAVYRSMEPAVVQAIFVVFYRVLAHALAAGDVTPLQTYLGRVVGDRLRDGATLAGFMYLVTSAQTSVRTLINREYAADPVLLATLLPQLPTLFEDLRQVIRDIGAQQGQVD
ncbi:MAG TPA: hypothetical protein VKY74_18590 [Chloroflexia bacterium]|nr:hypothetical protein [Chloroflexia bacterium]